MRWPGTRFLRVSDDLAREFWKRRREIARIHWDGAHPADVRYQCDELRTWVETMAVRGFSGSHTIVI